MSGRFNRKRTIALTAGLALAAACAAFVLPSIAQTAKTTLVTVPGAGHGLSGGDKKLVDAANDKAAAFIREHLK